MTAKLISNVLKATAVAAVPLAMLAASVPVNAQRPSQRNPIVQRGNMGQGVLAQLQRVRAAVSGVHPYESVGYRNSGEYEDSRYRRENDNNGYYEGKNKHDKNGRYKAKNKHYKNGYYRHGRGHNDYDRDRDRDRDNDRGTIGRYPTRYPSRGGVGYPSSSTISGFPNASVQSGRTGKTLPGTNQQQPRNNNRRRGN